MFAFFNPEFKCFSLQFKSMGILIIMQPTMHHFQIKQLKSVTE